MKEIFYKKVGRRYVPVYEYDQTLMDSFPKGNHLVMCYPGGQSRRFNIDPALAPMIAAGRVAEDAIRTAIQKASEARPATRVLTEEQQLAWKNMQSALGDERFYINYNSVADAVDAGMRAMQDEAAKLMAHPTVKAAYEQFLLVCELTKENHNV